MHFRLTWIIFFSRKHENELRFCDLRWYEMSWNLFVLRNIAGDKNQIYKEKIISKYWLNFLKIHKRISVSNINIERLKPYNFGLVNNSHCGFYCHSLLKILINNFKRSICEWKAKLCRLALKPRKNFKSWDDFIAPNFMKWKSLFWTHKLGEWFFFHVK